MNIKNVTFYEREIDVIKKELDELPEGRLRMKGKDYYIVEGSIETEITEDPEKVSQLARKAFLLKKLKNYEWNLSLIKRKSWQLEPEDPESIVRSLPKFYQELPGNFFCHSSVYKYFGNLKKKGDSYRDMPLHITDSGIRVQSKPERMIADSLDQAKIPYYYKAMLVVDGKIEYPDFMIVRPSDGKLVIWEHFEYEYMCEDEYWETVGEKLIIYVQNKYYPFDNLICTYAQDMNDPAYIRGLIDLIILR